MKILLIRFSSIGDIVLCSPIIRCLRQQTQAELHFLTKKPFAPLAENNPHISKVFSVNKHSSEALHQLKKENYTHVIDLHHNLRSLQVKLALGKPAHSFDKLNLEKWLLVNLGVNRLPPIHIVDRYFDTVRSLGVKNDGKGLDYFIPAADELPAESLLGEPAPPFTAFVLGATHATKRLTEEKIIAVARQIKSPVILLGGKAEAETGARVAQTLGPNILNCCGTLNLNQSASLVRQATVVLTHDTGLMHIAAAFHKNIVSVWGNTVPEFGMYPYYPTGLQKNTSMEVPGLPCRPCSKIGYEHCPKKHFKCINEQKPEIIAEKVNSFFDFSTLP